MEKSEYLRKIKVLIKPEKGSKSVSIKSEKDPICKGKKYFCTESDKTQAFEQVYALLQRNNQISSLIISKTKIVSAESG